MALREFTDSADREWRVWDVTADVIHPATRSEDYMRDYQDGWLAFESADGLAKCRLTPIPAEWSKATAADLERWLHAATAVRGERASGAFGRAEAEVAANPLLAATPRGPVRTFRFPGGRFWTATEHQGPAGGAAKGRAQASAPRVLRFTSGARSLDLAPFPANWVNMSDEQLAELLTSSFPRHSDPSESAAQRRRKSDSDR
jgi:hypothetical protein